MANIANTSETNPTAPGYKNPFTGAINPGYPASTAPFAPAPDPLYQINVSSEPAYSNATTYANGQAVTFDGKRYVSIVNQNVANRPDASPASWSLSPAGPYAPAGPSAPDSVEDLWAKVTTQIADAKKKDAELETTLHQLAVKTNQFFHS